MNPTPTIDLGNVQNPFTLAFIALMVGGLVRMLRTKTAAQLLEAIPVSWIKPLNTQERKWILPWIAMALSVLIVFADAKINGGATWQQAGTLALLGLLSGGLAVGGHETIAKLVGSYVYPPKGSLPPPTAPSHDGPGNPPPPPMVAPRALYGFLHVFAFSVLISAATVALSGCGAIISALPSIIAAVVDGGQILDAIEGFVSKWFVAHPDLELQKKVDNALDRCRMALNAALRVAQGAKDADEAKVDAAFENFKSAYIELINLVRPLGVLSKGAELRATPTADGKSLEVPEPLAFHPKRAK